MDWKSITTVFLDLDGTLLDLSFDNYFWHEFVPLRYGEKNQLEFLTAKQALLKRYKSKAGSLEWYCVDYWSDELGLERYRKKFPRVKPRLESAGLVGTPTPVKGQHSISDQCAS